VTTSSTPDDSTLPALTPQSQRIQAGVAHFGVARILGCTARPIEPFESIDTAPAELAVLTEDHLRPPVAPSTRPLERPNEVESWMDVCTPQFFLRNTHRARREDADPNRLQFDRAALLKRPETSDAIRAALRPRPPLEAAGASVEWATYVAQRAQLMVEPWPDRFGRPDPVEAPED
jgi:hypothetical protein